MLAGRQVNLLQAAARTAGEQAQVVGNLGEHQCKILDGAGNLHKTIGILGGVDQILCTGEGFMGLIREDAHHVVQVFPRGIDGSTDGGGAHIQHIHLPAGIQYAGQAALQCAGIGGEALAKAHGHGVLQLGAVGVDDLIQLAVDPVAGSTDAAADAAQLGAGVVGHLLLRQDAAADLIFQFIQWDD